MLSLHRSALFFMSSNFNTSLPLVCFFPPQAHMKRKELHIKVLGQHYSLLSADDNFLDTSISGWTLGMGNFSVPAALPKPDWEQRSRAVNNHRPPEKSLQSHSIAQVGWLVLTGGTLAGVRLSLEGRRWWISWDAAQGILILPKLFSRLLLGTDMEAKGAKRDLNLGEWQSFCKWWVEKKNFRIVQSYMLILWFLGKVCVKKMFMGIAGFGTLRRGDSDSWNFR